jgi:hypothetical protein
VTPEKGLVVPSKPGEWERKSLSLKVSKPYEELFEKFRTYFQKEAKAIGDLDLRQEQFVLDKLSKLDYSP